jgi:hypothetical protein
MAKKGAEELAPFLHWARGREHGLECQGYRAADYAMME